MFERAATTVAGYARKPFAFLGAFGIVLVWAISGPFLHFSTVWQLAINTGTTIVTFLMVFLIQNAQNRDTKALHLKLDELIHAIDSARNEVMTAESHDTAWLDEQLQTTVGRMETECNTK